MWPVRRSGLLEGQADGQGGLARGRGEPVYRNGVGVPTRGPGTPARRPGSTPGSSSGWPASRPWLLSIAAMIGGFVFQLTALRFGELALVQPILAAELLFVFGYLAVAGSRRPRLRDWLAAAAMSAGIGVFLRLAAPSGGRLHARHLLAAGWPGHRRRRAHRPGGGVRAAPPARRVPGTAGPPCSDRPPGSRGDSWPR